MNLTDIRKAKIPRKYKFPVGRGESSGVGKQSGRGNKGQWARQGTSFRFYFEGGQMSMIRRIPKRGFNNKQFKNGYEVVNLANLVELFADGATIDEAALRKAGLIRRHLPVKILAGGGDIKKKFTIKVHRVSESAIERIKKAGGTVEMLTPPDPKKGTKKPVPVKTEAKKAETKAPPPPSKEAKK